MQTRIQGTVLPVLDVQLNPGESIFSESGELSWMSPTIQMTTHTQAGGAGGMMGAFKRVMGGGTLFMTDYRATTHPGEVSFAAKAPGNILPVELRGDVEYLVHRHGFICGTPQITLGVAVQQSLGAGFFGGAGFRLQKVGGVGTAWLELGGEMITKNLAPGETLMVHPGHVGAFQSTVAFQVTTIPGIANKFFGGDGLFLVMLTGPGRVHLQTLPLSRLAHQIAEYLPGESGVGVGAGIGAGARVVGALMR